YGTVSGSPRTWSFTSLPSLNWYCTARPASSEWIFVRMGLPRSLPAPAAHPGSPTGCFAGSGIMPRSALTARSLLRSPALHWPFMTSTNLGWIGWTGLFSPRWCAPSAVGRSGYLPSLSRWERSPPRWRRCANRSLSGRACWPARRGDGWPLLPPGGTCGSSHPPKRLVMVHRRYSIPSSATAVRPGLETAQPQPYPDDENATKDNLDERAAQRDIQETLPDAGDCS